MFSFCLSFYFKHQTLALSILSPLSQHLFPTIQPWIDPNIFFYPQLVSIWRLLKEDSLHKHYYYSQISFPLQSPLLFLRLWSGPNLTIKLQTISDESQIKIFWIFYFPWMFTFSIFQNNFVGLSNSTGCRVHCFLIYYLWLGCSSYYYFFLWHILIWTFHLHSI